MLVKTKRSTPTPGNGIPKDIFGGKTRKMDTKSGREQSHLLLLISRNPENPLAAALDEIREVEERRAALERSFELTQSDLADAQNKMLALMDERPYLRYEAAMVKAELESAREQLSKVRTEHAYSLLAYKRYADELGEQLDVELTRNLSHIYFRFPWLKTPLYRRLVVASLVTLIFMVGVICGYGLFTTLHSVHRS